MNALNRDCFCVGLDDAQLSLALSPADLDALVRERCPHVFAARPVFVGGAELERMAAVVTAVESVVALPAYREAVFARAPDIARVEPMQARSVFFGYDFHLDQGRLGLIEINTNAGGALLNVAAARAQRGCCAPVERLLPLPHTADAFERDIVAMFRAEWRLARGDAPLRRIAIVDEAPQAQYLYPEFLLFKQLFEVGNVGHAGGQICGSHSDISVRSRGIGGVASILVGSVTPIDGGEGTPVYVL